MKSKAIVSVFGTLAMLCVASPAHAYLDPATGSIALQAVIGAIAGATLFLRTSALRILSVFARARPGQKK